MRHVIISILAIGTICISCKKPVDNTLEKITDTIIGRYECKSITIQSIPIDINCDGVAGLDMISEFSGIQMASMRIKEPVRIGPVAKYGDYMNIQIEIPKQRVNYNKRTSKYELKDSIYGDGMFICFKYSVTESGEIITSPNNEDNTVLGDEDDDMIYLVDYRNNSAKSLTFDLKGRFSAIIECTCYDYATNKMVTVPAEFVYERVSYSLY